MARSRYFKPSFFIHEELQDLQAAHNDNHPMLVYMGLWSLSDKNGVFEWKPRTIKCKILPFLEFKMTETLKILEDNGYIKKYTVDGKDYGIVITFKKHQRVSEAEKRNLICFPEPVPNQLETVPEPVQSLFNLKALNLNLKSLNTHTQILVEPQDTGPPGVEESVCVDSNEAQKIFLRYWQGAPDVFNWAARLESPNEFKHFWESSGVTVEQVKTALENFIADVRSGAIAPRYVPTTPDRFVLKGWILKCQKPFQVQEKTPDKVTGPPLGGPKKSLL
jgi:hypothetical protein